MRTLQCKGRELVLGERTLVMGIVNVTPDSFSDGGRFDSVERAVAHGLELVEQGADILDIGGESTRPGFAKVSAEEELRRVLPVIEELRKRTLVPISIDTYKAEVGRQALLAGADILNDVWGCKADPDMAGVAAEFGVPIILMHNRDNMEYGDFMRDVLSDLQESVAICKRAGVRDEQIVLDPGIGFAKTQQQNLETMAKLEQIAGLGYPVLLGTSRKSMIGHVLDLPVTERLEGTLATVTWGIAKGCEIVRVHDVKETLRVAKMTDAMMHGWK